MKSLNDIKQIIKNTKIKPTSEMRSRVLDEALKLQRNQNQQSTSDTHIWRIIVKSKITKFAAAAVIILFIGLVPINGTSAFGKMAHEVTSTLSRLKAAMLGEKAPGEDYSSERPIDKSVKILTRTRVYSVSETSSLDSVLNKNNISLASVDSGDAKYTVIPPGKYAFMEELLGSSSIKTVTCPSSVTFGGMEVMLWTKGTEDAAKTVGAAINVYKGKGEQLNIDFAFDNTDNGCEINGVKLAKGEALFVSGIKTDSGEIMAILSLPEIQNE